MSMTVGYKPYTGAINTNSARYKRAKAMYDEGHSNGKETKSAAEAKVEQDLQKLKMLKQMLGQKYDDRDFVNPYGVAGMDITGKDPSEFHKIIDVSETARQDMFSLR